MKSPENNPSGERYTIFDTVTAKQIEEWVKEIEPSATKWSNIEKYKKLKYDLSLLKEAIDVAQDKDGNESPSIVSGHDEWMRTRAKEFAKTMSEIDPEGGYDAAIEKIFNIRL